ncbi:MAG: hypothetical protein JXR91_15160 [Deltaproteobacteria bacterium]|nr:hypothetical protein [Deltaproteobacteria bacterium]
MGHLFRYFRAAFWVLSLLIAVNGAGAAETTDAFYERFVNDVKEGRPLVTTVYVALCDNDSQGIIPVKNRKICDGDFPENNMYWKGDGGIYGYLKSHQWKRVKSTKNSDGAVIIEDVWHKRLWPGKKLKEKGVTKPFSAYVVAKAYRGSNIHDAMVDYLKAVNNDTSQVIKIDEDKSISAGGGSHLAGYIGHDYFMDPYPDSREYKELVDVHKNGTGKLAKGAFALACISNEFVRPAIERESVYIMALNNFLTYPSAWTVGGIIDGVAALGSGYEIYKSYTKAFAKGQNCGLKWAKNAFSFGP